MRSIKALPPLFKIASAQFFPKFLKESKVQLFLIVCFSFPSKENKTPSKSILSDENVAKAPIGALATFTLDKIDFEGVLFSLDGKEKHTIKKSCTFDSYKNFGKNCAEEILNNGGSALMESIRRDLKK